MPGGKIFTYGLFEGENQIGFQCFAAYIIGDQRTFFSNRTVIHPDFAGLGLGIRLINETSKQMVRDGYKIRAKFSSTPIYKAMSKQKESICTDIKKDIKKLKVSESMKRRGGMGRENTMRSKTTTYHFKFIWAEKQSHP